MLLIYFSMNVRGQLVSDQSLRVLCSLQLVVYFLLLVCTRVRACVSVCDLRSSKRKVSKKCLNDLILWLDDVKDSADGRKVILLAHNGFCCHFKVLCLNLDKYE